MEKVQVVKKLMANGWSLPDATKTYRYLSCNEEIKIDKYELDKYIITVRGEIQEV